MSLFEHRITYPDSTPSERLAGFVGLDDHKSAVDEDPGAARQSGGAGIVGEETSPERNGVLTDLAPARHSWCWPAMSAPGKSELAETIGDAVARQENIDITLFPMSLSTRGQGRVGEMTQLLSAAFDTPWRKRPSSKASRASRGAPSFFWSTRPMRSRNRAKLRRCT